MLSLQGVYFFVVCSCEMFCMLCSNSKSNKALLKAPGFLNKAQVVSCSKLLSMLLEVREIVAFLLVDGKQSASNTSITPQKAVMWVAGLNK
jgi:hypothetical protein